MMPVNTTTAPKPTSSQIRILQLNTHRSQNVTTALFNDSATCSFHFLLIQEPPNAWQSNRVITDPNWHIIEPLTDSSFIPDEDSRIKSIIYVNNALPTFSFSPLTTNSHHIAGVKLTLPSR